MFLSLQDHTNIGVTELDVLLGVVKVIMLVIGPKVHKFKPS
jgi:hypothetical protein